MGFFLVGAAPLRGRAHETHPPSLSAANKTTHKHTAAAIEGLDLGVQGMRVGGVRSVIVPPELGYGNASLGEIQPNSTLDVRVELLSIKGNAFGTRVKLVEG